MAYLCGTRRTMACGVQKSSEGRCRRFGHGGNGRLVFLIGRSLIVDDRECLIDIVGVKLVRDLLDFWVLDERNED